MVASGKVGRLEFGFALGRRASDGAAQRGSSAALAVLIVADSSGRRQRGGAVPLVSLRPRPIDIDRLDGAFASFGARLELPAALTGGKAIELSPRSLDDLHPDQLLHSVPELAELCRLKKALATDPSAASRLTEVLGRPAPAPSQVTPEASDAEPPSGVRESSDETLSRLLGGSPSQTGVRPAAPPAGAFDVDRLVRSLIGGLTGLPTPPEDTTALASAAEHAIGERLRSILRAADFRQLETTWRAIDGLVRQAPDQEHVRLFVLDVSPLDAVADIEAFERLLEPGFDVVLLDHVYRPDASELEGLARVLHVCGAKGVGVVAGASPELAGCPGFDRAPDPEAWTTEWPDGARQAWAELCRVRESGAQLSLALPRFLLRQPYGSAGETLEALRFEEILDTEEHEAFCWGNGAYLVARALGELRASGGEVAHADGSVDLRELPVVHLEGEDGIRIKPCAEAWLSDRALGRLLSAGFSVLHGQRDSDRVRVHL